MPLKVFNQVRYRLLFLIILAALPGLLLLIIIAKQQWKITEDATRDSAIQTARESIQLTIEQIKDTNSILQELSQNPAIQNQNANTCQSELSKRLQQSPQYTNFGVVSSNGEVYCSAIPLSDPISISDRLWFQQVSQSRTPMIGGFQVSPITQTPVLPIGYPVFDEQEQLTSVVFASLNVELLNSAIIQQLPPNTTVNILDQQGVMLDRHPDPEQWVGKSVKDSALFQELTASQDNAVEVTAIEGVDGNLRLFAFSRLSFDQETELYVAVGIPDALIREQVAWSTGQYALIVAVPTLFLLGLAWYTASVGIQYPIQLLTNAAQQLAIGDLTARTELPTSSGEFRQLAAAYNSMATELERYIDQRVAVQKDREVAELKNRL